MKNNEKLEKVDLNSIPSSNIFQLSFELFNNIMIIDLNEPMTINNRSTKKIRIKSTYDKYKVKLFELNRYKGLI